MNSNNTSMYMAAEDSMSSSDMYQTQSATSSVLYPCEFCGKNWDTRYKLDIHLRTHTGETPFICEVCNRPFNVLSNLRRHVRTVHSISRPFQCEFCGKSFNQNSNLKRHQKVHCKDVPASITPQELYMLSMNPSLYQYQQQQQQLTMLHPHGTSMMIPMMTDSSTMHSNSVESSPNPYGLVVEPSPKKTSSKLHILEYAANLLNSPAKARQGKFRRSASMNDASDSEITEFDDEMTITMNSPQSNLQKPSALWNAQIEHTIGGIQAPASPAIEMESQISNYSGPISPSLPANFYIPEAIRVRGNPAGQNAMRSMISPSRFRRYDSSPAEMMAIDEDEHNGYAGQSQLQPMQEPGRFFHANATNTASTGLFANADFNQAGRHY